jgi:bifunctional oligoribonuclease and PAP phosphatase NrnA
MVMIPDFPSHLIQDIRELLSVPRKVVITTHYKPDGDAIGSSLALWGWLLDRGHQVTVVSPSDYPEFLQWMTGNDQVINAERKMSAARKVASEADLIFCLDFNTASRMEATADAILASKAFKVLIDHHPQPDSFCNITFSYPESCATCELVFHFLKAVEPGTVLTSSVADCLYAGIMTDTGSFRFSSTTADTHLVIAELIRSGADGFRIHERIFDHFSEARTRFLGLCLKEKLVVLEKFKTAYIWVTKEELEQHHHQTGDTEGIVNYALGIKGIRFAAFFCERDNLIKISFRSKGSFSVNEFARTHFSGGGHTNAAGGRSKESLDLTLQKFLAVLPDYETKLNLTDD